MNFTDAMDLLTSGKKVTRHDWKDGLYFIFEDGHVTSYQPILEPYQYNEDIMISNGWITEDGWITVDTTESRKFSEIIPELKNGKRAWMIDWKEDFYIYFDPQHGLVIHKMSKFDYHPSFDDFQANDWIEL